ncbi:hypothetical protein NP233_g2126 [Leucocoprinus birnbaumii]|uniref:Protein kinase domain-containing protein n=1 Tax=Leucocoprinus birnbaumii TaxID=56174 RepID=A0AAD5YZ98_9AGAR|nr:hypothetical protein NP233_g2126 [Leucocoprinus birnbaumii]
MSLSWLQRKAKLSVLLKSEGDEEADGIALDRLLHGQKVIGKTPRTAEIDALKFQDKDLQVVGTLEYGQYGVIDVVTCRLDGRTYVRKSTEKRFALRTRDQCFPQFERDILLQAMRTDSEWAPHLLCAFQTPTHLNLVMEYAEGGSLWDVLESSPNNGRLLDHDLQWWIPQIVSAIHWCHTQGFVHRDIKPQNFVLRRDAHLLLIDFGSAAPLLPPGPDGSQLLPKRYCTVPCGTCDYISPEILQAHEAALVALEMEEDEELPSLRSSRTVDDDCGYGVETDWWSFGAMLYEMAYGTAPFFANEIRHTYQKIMNHERSLRFDDNIPVPSVYKDFIRKLLTRPERRIGRHSIVEITDHPLFEAVNWTNMHEQPAPEELHLPQFTYNEQPAIQTESLAKSQYEESISQGFAFSALFQSSPLAAGTSPGMSMSRQTLSTPAKSAMQEDPSAAFIGFSWGPARDAFPSLAPDEPDTLSLPNQPTIPSTPQVTRRGAASHLMTPILPSITPRNLTTPQGRYHTFSTPNNRPYAFTPFRTNTLPRSAPRTIQRRDLSDREAMKQLVDCVGMSARKRVLESGRKPRILTNPASLRSRSGYGSSRKELRFVGDPIPMPDYHSFSNASASLSSSVLLGNNTITNTGVNTSNPLDTSNFPTNHHQQQLPNRPSSLSIPLSQITNDAPYSASDTGDTEITESEGPPSPSPRPTSALSTSLSLSRRSGSATPTATMTLSMMLGGNSSANGSVLTRRSSGSGTSLLAVPGPSTVSGSMLMRSASLASVLDTRVGGEEVGGKKVEVEEQLPAEERNMNKASTTSMEDKVSRSGKFPRMNQDHEPPSRSSKPPERRVASTTTTTQPSSTNPQSCSTVFKRRHSDADITPYGQRVPSFTRVHRDRLRRDGEEKLWAGAMDDAYGKLEERLDALMEEIGDIESKLARLKVAL